MITNLEFLDLMCDAVIFSLACWAIFTHKIIDGVVIRLGAIIVALGAMADFTADINAVFLGIYHVVDAIDIWTKVGMTTIAIGVVLRTCVYPKLSKNYPVLKPLNKPIFDRRHIDLYIDRDRRKGHA